MTAPRPALHRPSRTRRDRTRTGRGLALTLTLTVALAAGCSGAPDGTPEGTPGGPADTSTGSGSPTEEMRGDVVPDDPAVALATTETEPVSDPVEQAFTVQMPVGWTNLAYSTSEFGVHREVVTSTSPDSGTVLFVGDPRTPQFWNPDTANEITVKMSQQLDYMKLQRYTPATTYIPAWVKTKFGKLPGFRITGTENDVESIAALQRQLAGAGMAPADAEACNVRFTYQGDAGPMQAYVTGFTINSGDFWQADAGGISTNGSVDDYLEMLNGLSKTKKTNPEWTARKNAEHQQVMDSIQAGTDRLIAQHNANMNTLQGMAESHQTRMQAIWSANDASQQQFQQRMDSMDSGQRSFLNYVNDESTVSNSAGQTYQVDDSYQRYWMKADGSYVGGDVNFGDSQLRAMGLNPSDYEEVKVLKR